MSLFFYNTKIGKIGIEEKNEHICGVYFGDKKFTEKNNLHETPLIKKAYFELEDYLNCRLKNFSVPLNPCGTEFMLEIWQLLTEIPYGQTLSYKNLAEKCGKPKSSRAIGVICSKNPLPIFIPCHRVIGSNGKIKGYLGGKSIKEKLLSLETPY